MPSHSHLGSLRTVVHAGLAVMHSLKQHGGERISPSLRRVEFAPADARLPVPAEWPMTTKAVGFGRITLPIRFTSPLVASHFRSPAHQRSVRCLALQPSRPDVGQDQPRQFARHTWHLAPAGLRDYPSAPSVQSGWAVAIACRLDNYDGLLEVTATSHSLSYASVWSATDLSPNLSVLNTNISDSEACSCLVLNAETTTAACPWG